MSLQPPANLQSFPFTSALPVIGNIVDPTCSKVIKIAIILFATLAIIPLAITLITLTLDGFYILASCLCPNLHVESQNEVPDAAQPQLPESSALQTPVNTPPRAVSPPPAGERAQSPAPASPGIPHPVEAPIATPIIAQASALPARPETPPVVNQEEDNIFGHLADIVDEFAEPRVEIFSVSQAAALLARPETPPILDQEMGIILARLFEAGALSLPQIAPAPAEAAPSIEEQPQATVAVSSAAPAPISLEVQPLVVAPPRSASPTPIREQARSQSLALPDVRPPIDAPPRAISPPPISLLRSPETDVQNPTTPIRRKAPPAQEPGRISPVEMAGAGRASPGASFYIQADPRSPFIIESGSILSLATSSSSSTPPRSSQMDRIALAAVQKLFGSPTSRAVGNQEEPSLPKMPAMEQSPSLPMSISHKGRLTEQQLDDMSERACSDEFKSKLWPFFDGDLTWYISQSELAFLLVDLKRHVPAWLRLSEEEYKQGETPIWLRINNTAVSIKTKRIITFINQCIAQLKIGSSLQTPAMKEQNATKLRSIIEEREQLLSQKAAASSSSQASALAAIQSPDRKVPLSNGTNEATSFNTTTAGAILQSVKGCFLDPGNLDKGKKYAYSLFVTQRELKAKFKKWKKLLPALEEQTEKSGFASCAFIILDTLRNCGTSDVDIRSQYKTIVENLRQALLLKEQATTPESIEALQMLEHLCHFKFTKVSMYPFLEDFISKALRAAQREGDEYKLPAFGLNTLATDVEHANKRLTTIPVEYRQTSIAKEFKKLEGTLGFGFDPTGGSNTPWVHSIQTFNTAKGAKTRTILRHGTPTCDPSMAGLFFRESLNLGRQMGMAASSSNASFATVIPEYKAHLNADLEKISLYVNHQTHDESGSASAHGEIDRSHAIQNLERAHPNFHFLALPLDGPIWKKGYLQSTSIDKLKEDVLEAIISQTKGFAIPKKFKEQKAELTVKIGEILNHVQELYFPLASWNTIDEKKIFLMLFYSELKDLFSEQLEVDFLVSACKDNKDRGNASTTVDMMKNLVKLGKENDLEALKELFFSVLAPFIIKNESIIHERLELATLVIDHFSKMTDLQKAAIRKHTASQNATASITSQIVPKESVSWAQMVGPKAFLAIVEGTKQRKEQRIIRQKNFDQVVSVDYRRDTSEGILWNLVKLKGQIAKDLPRMEITLNGERMRDFNTLCEKLGISPSLFAREALDSSFSANQRKMIRLMALLHQGAAAEAILDPSRFLNGNVYVVAQPHEGAGGDRVHQTQLFVNVDPESGELDYRLLQKMKLSHCEDQGVQASIQAKIEMDDNFEAKLSWHFE